MTTTQLQRDGVATPDDLRFWLALWRAPGLGPRRFLRLLARFDEPAAVFAASDTALQAAELTAPARAYIRNPDWDAVETDLDWQSRAGHRVILYNEPDYPALLREIADPPPLLFVNGDSAALSRFQLAMVGSRNPSPGGSRTAAEFAGYLAGAGLVITSGLADGVDAACHRGALEAGGTTIAVTGTGPDRVYPAGNRELAERIVACGAILSEFPVGTRPHAANFPRRNRIISGLSLGTLVVEAATRSGSLITARHATEQGREVFAIPGSIHNPMARGCHALIRQGAKLVETAQDVIEELGALAGFVVNTAPEDTAAKTEKPDEEHIQLLESMGYEPVTVDQLTQRTGLTPEAVSSMLLILELQGFVASSPGGVYCRAN